MSIARIQRHPVVREQPHHRSPTVIIPNISVVITTDGESHMPSDSKSPVVRDQPLPGMRSLLPPKKSAAIQTRWKQLLQRLQKLVHQTLEKALLARQLQERRQVGQAHVRKRAALSGPQRAYGSGVPAGSRARGEVIGLSTSAVQPMRVRVFGFFFCPCG